MHKYTVELRIYGKDLDTTELAGDLGIKPTLMLKRGDKIAKNKRVKESLWAYNGIREGQQLTFNSLEDGLKYLLEKLWPLRSKIATYKSKHRVILWCGHSQNSFDGGPLLSSDVLRLLGEFGIDLFIDNYFSD